MYFEDREQILNVYSAKRNAYFRKFTLHTQT